MSRKKSIPADSEREEAPDNAEPKAPSAMAELEALAEKKPAPPEQISEQDNGEKKQWSNPYSSIFTSVSFGFEMGEDRRYKQRVFKFAEKPSQEIIDILKQHGFVYRPSEKSWTISATPETRQLTEELARQFAGNTQDISR